MVGITDVQKTRILVSRHQCVKTSYVVKNYVNALKSNVKSTFTFLFFFIKLIFYSLQYFRISKVFRRI